MSHGMINKKKICENESQEKETMENNYIPWKEQRGTWKL